MAFTGAGVSGSSRLGRHANSARGEHGHPGCVLLPLVVLDSVLTQDNQEEATIGAFLFHELMQRVCESGDLDNEIDEILQDFEIKCKRPILHSVLFY